MKVLGSGVGAAAACVSEGDERGARDAISGLVALGAGGDGATHRLARLFAAGLEHRLASDRRGLGNLYLDGGGPERMLAAYRVLVEQTPLVRFGHDTAIGAIVERIGDAEAVHLVDIGFGTGAQWNHLFARLAGRRGAPPRVHLTGIEIPASTEDPLSALRLAGGRLSAIAASHKVPFEFEPIACAIEQLDVIPRREGLHVVNAALALHHTPSSDAVRDDRRSRDAVLRRIFDSGTDLLILVEPDADHDALRFHERVGEAVRHYGGVFQVLEDCVPGGSDERATIEQAFFGREIVNVVCGEGAARVERHERLESWQRRLRRIGFGPSPIESHAEAALESLGLDERASLQVVDGGVRLAWRDTPLLSASAWVPAFRSRHH